VRVFLVVNPAASSVSERARDEIEALLRVTHDVETAETARRNHATELARSAATDGFEVVVVLAGDGTLNEAANGLIGTTTALAPLPGGSTNVFARSIGVPYDTVDAARRLVSSLAAGRQRRIGVGCAQAEGRGPRHFLFNLGIGFDAAVIRRMEQRSYLKRHFAHPAFAMATVATWLRHYDRDARIGVSSHTVEGQVVTATGPYAVVSNTDPYTYVGRRRLRISPSASLDAPLAVSVIRALRMTLLLRAFASGLWRARFVSDTADIAQVARVVRTQVTSVQPFPWQVDGDYLGDVTELDITYEADALTLVVP
jgi:diacylglycerol kinase family enzyme